MRMRKLPWAEDFIKQEAIVEKYPASCVGTWKQKLHCETLHVEVGTGKGDYWILMAQKYPNQGWLGIEKNVNVAALAVRKYTQLGSDVPTMGFICDDAQDIRSWFGDGEVDVIHLNFSDPWPKKRTHKKRLSNHSFIKQYYDILQADGEIQMKSDNVSLFEYSVLQFQNEGWFLHEFHVDYRSVPHDEDVMSEYERRFHELGQPIFRAVWKKYPMKKES